MNKTKQNKKQNATKQNRVWSIPFSCLEELGTFASFSLPKFNVCFAWNVIAVLWLTCTCFLSPNNLPWNLFPDLVQTHKTLSASHLSTQRPTDLPGQPLEDSFLSPGELFHFQSFQISLCTCTSLTALLSVPWLCCPWSFEGWHESPDPFPVGQTEVVNFCSLHPGWI